MKPSGRNGNVPKGWRLVRLGDVAEVVMGQSPPGDLVSEWDAQTVYSDGLPFIQGNAEFGAKFPCPVKWCSQPPKASFPGDVLISVRAPVGETNKVHGHLCIGRGLAAVRFKEANQDFGWHLTNHAKIDLERVAQGSTFSAIGSNELRYLPILLPPLPEQRAIAAVLDSIDDAIERTGAVIAATEELRDSLLHQLLTRGVPGWHTEWKEAPGLGTIPAGWEVVRLGEVAEIQTGKAVNRQSPAGGEVQIPYLSVANVKDGYLDLSEVKTLQVYWGETERYGLKAGDVLFTEGGDADKLGRGTVWREEIPLCIHQNHVFAVRPHSEELMPVFLAFFAASRYGKKYFLGAAKQTTNLASINSTQLREMPLPLPNIREQQAIAELLDGMDATIAEAKRERDGLQLLKGSTADALLTGQIRVEGT